MNKSVTISANQRGLPVSRFYSGKSGVGFDYKVRPIGFRGLIAFIFGMFGFKGFVPLPYFIGDTIKIRLSLKTRIADQIWQQGTINREPPKISKEEPQYEMSDTVFSFVDFPDWPQEASIAPLYTFTANKWVSRTLFLESGSRVRQTGTFTYILSIQNHHNNYAAIIADIADVTIEDADSFFWRSLAIILALSAVLLSVGAIVVAIVSCTST